MLKVKKYLYFAIISLIIAIFQFVIPVTNASASTVSRGECVMEVSSGRILSSVNENLKLPMASTTKILTAITVIDNFDISKEITVPKTAVGIEGSSIYLREGEKLTVKELLYGLMLRSGNDCAECLAQTLINRDKFIALMNETAKKCGAYSSNFVNPHGLPCDNHYTTAYDLCKITCYALKNSIFKEICSTKRINVSNDGYDYDRVLINKNKLLYSYEGATGVKTGYTKKAGRCLVSSAKRNGMEVVAVVINSPDMWARSTELLDGAFSNYQLCNLLDVFDYEKVYTSPNNKKFTFYNLNSVLYPLKSDEISSVKTSFNDVTLEEFVKNPSKTVKFEIFVQNKLIFSQNIFTILSK